MHDTTRSTAGPSRTADLMVGGDVAEGLVGVDPQVDARRHAMPGRARRSRC